MKLLIATLNSKYTHTSLSVRCLYNAVKDICRASFAEYTINDNIESIVADIFAKKPDCLAFSCYIWNIESIFKISSVIKKALPQIKIVLGGHEAEHDGVSILENNLFIDAVLRGEGEISLREYVKCVLGKKDISTAFSITYRNGGEIISLPDSEDSVDLNSLPFVYDETIEDLKNRIIYYETSRGCPYNCSYCLSGEGHRVRFLDTERVKKELKFFMDKKVALVKLVDRTFNADIKRAKEIFEFIADNPSDTCFHMELSGDLIDNETLTILKRVKKGTLQFEIGVQTTNPDTLRAINRRVTFKKLQNSVKRLMEEGNIHIHLDLIAGLPFEDIASFKKSFNEVLSLKPHVLQLGFLKMLKGSPIREESQKHGYVYRDYPPYEVISNDYISMEDLMELKLTEDALDKFYNSGAFKNTLDYLMDRNGNYYSVFLALGNFMKTNYPTGYSFSKKALYDIMYECFAKSDSLLCHELRKDYLIFQRPGIRPHWLGIHDDSLVEIAYEMFKDEDYKKRHYPCYYDVPAKEIMKHIYVERINNQVLAFDYLKGCVYDITDYCSEKISQ